MSKYHCLSAIRAFTAVVVMATSSGRAAESIVGTWAPDPSECTPVGGMVAIGPLSLVADELACRFATVVRAGDKVTWRGRCSTGGAAPTPATVTAALRSGNLAITIDGAPSGTLRRCRPQ